MSVTLLLVFAGTLPMLLLLVTRFGLAVPLELGLIVPENLIPVKRQEFELQVCALLVLISPAIRIV